MGCMLSHGRAFCLVTGGERTEKQPQILRLPSVAQDDSVFLTGGLIGDGEERLELRGLLLFVDDRGLDFCEAGFF